ncbi:hypothetical protein D3C80_1767160 [compost metagenome]
MLRHGQSADSHAGADDVEVIVERHERADGDVIETLQLSGVLDGERVVLALDDARQMDTSVNDILGSYDSSMEIHSRRDVVDCDLQFGLEVNADTAQQLFESECILSVVHGSPLLSVTHSGRCRCFI